MNKKKKATPVQLKNLAKGRKIRAANIRRNKRKASGTHTVKATKRRKVIKRKVKKRKKQQARYQRIFPKNFVSFKRYN